MIFQVLCEVLSFSLISCLHNNVIVLFRYTLLLFLYFRFYVVTPIFIMYTARRTRILTWGVVPGAAEVLRLADNNLHVTSAHRLRWEW